MSLDLLQAFYRERRLIIFIGAGVSLSIQPPNAHGTFPSWEGLVNKAADMLTFSDPDLLRARGTDLQILEYYRLRNGGDVSPLTAWLIRTMDVDEATLHTAPIYAELAAMEHVSLIYTTNYDDFIERALRTHGKSVTVIAKETDADYSQRADFEVVKFHGDWNNPSRMVITDSDYYARLDFRDVMDRRFSGDLLNRAVLFLGYSFRDPNIAYLFSSLKDRRLPSFITVADPADFEYRLFRARNIEVEGITRFHEAEGIAQLLRSIRE